MEGAGGGAGCSRRSLGEEGVNRGQRGFGVAFYGGRWCTVSSCAGEAVAVAASDGCTRGRVWGARGVGLGRGERREIAGKGQRITRVSLLIGALRRQTRMRARSRGGRRRRGKEHCGSQTSRRIVGRAGEARGGRRRLEGDGYSVGVHCSALWSTPIACQGMPSACRARPLVSRLFREE